MSGPIDTILIPTDDSDGALTGAYAGIALASQTNADIHIVSVIDIPTGAREYEKQAISALEGEALEATQRVEGIVRAYDATLSVESTVMTGTPFQSIREYAHRREIDTIVMGTKGRSGLDRALLGSVTENVLRTARMPVLAVPPACGIESVDDQSFDNFLLPSDGSDGAEIAVAWCIALAHRLEAMIHAIYSVDTSRFSGRREPSEIIGVLEDRGEQAIEHVRQRARDCGVSVTGSLATGQPAPVILESATQKHVDLIVMGTHGRTGIGQWFLGSVTENVVRGSNTPVFCVPVSARDP